jgi:hypothetical protein
VVKVENLNQVVITKSVNGVEVATLTELGILLGVMPSTILGWVDKYKDFPKSVAEVKGAGRNGRSRLFPIDAVRVWHKKHATTRKANNWTGVLTKLSQISKSSPATYKIILEMIDEASGVRK